MKILTPPPLRSERESKQLVPACWWTIESNLSL